ncbi:pentapeptide repeat-containing protein [Nocardia takedensis]|uniref:pentapeptide repeat-containing protein n=1 Tax=Nocardia takedensis TaxID=259390 RepID=UPI003F758222
MSEGEKAVVRPAEEKTPGSRGGVRVWMRGRSRAGGVVLAAFGGAVGGFGAAVLSGVPVSFGQPLATLLGGTGVLAAGVLAYLTGQRSREQAEAHHKADSRHERELALRDRYTAVAAQIADRESAAIRQAGIYALTALADDWHAFGEDDERQVCINLLQWYLRVPFPVADDPDKPDLSEREIRQTIVSILTQRRHRPSEDPKSWASTTISLSQVSLPGCTLNLLHFPGNRWFRADMSDADLTGANLSGANLSGTNLRGANLSDADLSRADLRGADLSRATLRGADLSGAHLTGANLTGADLQDVHLSGTNLTGAHLSGAHLTGANLINANLSDANLNGAHLTGAHLFGADLSRANLFDADLSRAHLIGADLSGAHLTGANLTDANLNGANLNGANLSDANLTDAKVDGVIHAESTLWPTGFTPPPAPV